METFENKVVVAHRQPFMKYCIVEIGKVGRCTNYKLALALSVWIRPE